MKKEKEQNSPSPLENTQWMKRERESENIKNFNNYELIYPLADSVSMFHGKWILICSL